MLRHGALLAGLALGLLLMGLVPVAAGVTSPQNGSLRISEDAQITPLYDVFGSNAVQVSVDFNGTFLSPAVGAYFSVETLFNPHPSATALLGNGSAPESLSITPTISGGIYTTTFTIPNGTISFQATMSGTFSGATFLWRYLLPVSSVYGYTGSGFDNVSQTFNLEVPAGTVLSQLYGPNGATLAPSQVLHQGVASNGEETFSVNVASNLFGLIVFQSRSFLPASIALTAVALAVVALAALNLFTEPRLILQDLASRFRQAGAALLRALRIQQRSRKSGLRVLFRPRNLLVLFVLCAIVMVSLAVVGGPDPRVKAYVVAGSDSSQVQAQLQQAYGNALVLTPSQDYTDFAVMESVGQFNMVVISNSTTGTAQFAEESSFIIGSMGSVPAIVLVGDVDAGLNATLHYLYPGQVVDVPNAAAIASNSQIKLLLVLSQRTNVLGLDLSSRGFELLLVVEALLSMLIVLVGWAYLGSLASDFANLSDASNLAAIICSGVFVFFFSEAVYIATSSLLAVPLSLHAVTSDAHDVTAVGLLGFGGGSTPRLAAGVLGVFIGAVGGGLKVRKGDLALVAGLALVLIANPLSIGQFVFQGILLFLPIGNYAFGAAYSSSLGLKGFIYGFGAILGGGVTGAYLLSAGKILYFAGLVPLAFLKKMGRTTTVIALLVVAFIVGDGGVRVGEMTPDKTVAALMPGLIAGFAFGAVLLAIAAIEKYVRGNWKSRA